MQFGLVISVIVHAAILGWALFTIHAQRDLGMAEPEPIITDLISENELTKLKKGVRTAKQLEAMAKESPKADVAKKEAPKPKPVAAAPAPPPPPDPPAPKSDPIAEKLASAEPPPPPPPPAVEEKKKIEEQARQALEQQKADEQRRAAEEQLALEGLRKAEEQRKADEERRAEEQRKLDEQRQAEEQRKADEQRKAEEQRQAEEKRRLEEERKQAELKKKADEEKKRKEAAAKKKREEEKKRQEALAKQKEFDAEKIAALLNKTPNSATPTPSSDPTEPTKAKGPALGAPEGRDKQISASEMAMLKGMIQSRLRGCWTVPSGGGGSDTPVVTLRWRLRPDGSLDGDPQVDQPRPGTLFQLAAEAAIRAVHKCAPFSLPADKFLHWKTIIWDFDPSQM